MANEQHTCSGCIPIDASILEVYIMLLDAIAAAGEKSREQSDWAQTNPYKTDFIKNKPDLSHYVTEEEIAGLSNVFVAVAGTTTYAEVTTALAAGKSIFLNRSGTVLPFTGSTDDHDYVFTGVDNAVDTSQNTSVYVAMMSPSGTINAYRFNLVMWKDVVSTLNAQSTNSQVPGAKCVYDAIAEKYSKPASGIPASDIASGVIPDVSGFVTKSVNDLVNYYLKSDTYTKSEVNSLIGAIQGFSYEAVSELPSASASTMGKIYLVPSADPQTQNVKDEYITIDNGSGSNPRYTWEQIGSTAIDLSGYVTTTQLDTALAAYTTTANLTTLLAGKQDVIADLTTIRSGATAGSTAVQYTPVGSITPPATPSDWATAEEVSQLEAEVHNLSGKYYGAYTSDTDLPEGDALGYAFVGESDPLALYEFRDGEWNESGIEISGIVGPPGVQGLPGATGEQGPAGVTSVVASVDSGTGVPSVDVTLVGQTLNLVFHNLKGVQGNTGSSVSYAFELVNNLTTDDATKGLSAAQGKFLYDLIEGTPVSHYFDLSSYTEENDCIGSNDTWMTDGGSPRNCICIPIAGITNLKVVTSGNGYIAFLNSLAEIRTGTSSVTAHPDFSTGYPGRIRVDTTTVEYATLPADANYLYVQTRFVDGVDVRDRYSISYKTPSNGVIFRNEIVDNLASEETIYPLSAKQGKVLKGLVDGNTDNIGRLLAQNGGSFAGKKVSIIGDSVSTILNGNTPYWTVLSVDVGQTIQSYVTWEDIYGNYRYPDRTHPTGKTIGGVTLTEAMVDGELHSFTPALADVGKEIGVPHHYPNNDGTFQVWSQRVCDALGMTLLANASWSGSAITSMEVEGRGIDFTASQAWHPCTIGRCRGRNATTGAFINPDIIIVYRGTNDFSYGNNGEYPTLQISDVSLLDGFSATTDKVGDSTYNFRIGYYLTIKALREAYPNAIIYIATLNVFKRVHYDMWPTRNDSFTLPELNKVIREIADATGCGIIELDKDGITFENCYPTYINDSQYTPTHPNGNGHRVMAEKAVTDLVYSLNPTA